MKIYRWFLIGICFFIAVSCASTDKKHEMSVPIAMSAPVYEKIMDNVFEVVVDKLEPEKIKYGKELPFDKLDYKIRNDKYIPIGTAFLLEDGNFYTAQHVVSLEYRTQFENFYLRDRNEKVFPIDKILAFSDHVDYICFSVDGYDTKGKGLKVADSVQLNSPVFSVGNALGDGIIIRNGVYTSDTPENHDGKWSWLRFSAAANPGNSGGPLVKEDGSVIGIVSMVNDTQNFNFAVPIKEVVKGVKEKIGEVDIKFFSYSMPNIENELVTDEVKGSFPLPMSLQELRKQVAVLLDNASKKSVSSFREKFEPSKPQAFDNTRGSAELLMYENRAECPIVLYRTKSGLWEKAYLSKMGETKLKKNGSVKNVSDFNTSFCLFKKPDDVSFQSLIDNPKLVAEYLLEGAPWHRNVAGEKIRVTSFGEPYKTDKYVDFFGRTWFVNYFDLLYSDEMMVTFSLPVPGGILEMCQVDNFGQALNCIDLDMQFLADFTTISYKAKIKDWKEYLSLSGKDLKTAYCESSIKMEQNADGIKVSAGDKLSIDLPSDVIEIGEDGYLTVSFGYNKSEDGKVTLEPSSIRLETAPKAKDPRILYLGVMNKPDDDALDTTKDEWYKMTHGITPFDGKPVDNKQDTISEKVFLPKGSTSENAGYVYLLSFNAICGNDKDLQQKLASKVESCLRLH